MSRPTPPIPPSLLKAGYMTQEQARARRGLLIGTEGQTDSGKTEFMMSAPEVGAHICVDRNFDPALKNPNPPAARNKNHYFKVISAPLAGTATQEEYKAYWNSFRTEYYSILNNPDIRTVGLDGDSDTWELQRLAAFGKLTKVPAIFYVDVNAARRAMIARAYDAGKIVIATNKVKDEYIDSINPKTGEVNVGDDGKPKRVKSGSFERQGYSDQDYLWHIQLRHMYQPGTTKTIIAGPRAGQTVTSPGQWGIKILKAKAAMEMVGVELWGDQCNFKGLVSTIYPQIPLSSWGL